MKKIFVLSMLIPFAMICSCQKQDSAAEQQLAQRKAELDAREKALDEREKATALGVQHRIPDPAQVKAEKDRRLQQLPPGVKALLPDPSQLKAGKDEKDKTIQERLAQKQRMLEELQRMKSGAPGSPEAEATSPSPSPQ